MNVIIENTIYSLFIYLLIRKEWRKDIYILDDKISNKVLIKLKDKVKKADMYPMMEKATLRLILKYYKYCIINFNIFFQNEKVYGYDGMLFSSIFRWKGFNLLEDGLKNYRSCYPKTSRIKNLLKLSPMNYSIDGIDKRVQKIYLTGLAPIPKEIAHKVEIIDLKELWDKKTIEEQNEILDVFSFDLNIKETIKDRDIILFTQPLSEDGVITEDEKVEIYSKIIKKYPQNRLIVKTHPREKTNYKEIFKNNLVLDNPFPFEILNLLDVKFDKAVTLFSTAALGLGEDVKVDFYGTEINDKILARFGSCDNIMKRNSYLEEE